MMSVDHKTKQLTLHEVRPERSDEHGAINARDVGDFLHQVNGIFAQTTGKDPVDDSYDVRGDEEGLVASWTTKADKLDPGYRSEPDGLTRHQKSIQLLERTRDLLRRLDLAGDAPKSLLADIIGLVGPKR